MALRFLLLMRHAKHTSGRPEEKRKRFRLFKRHSNTVLTAEGASQTLAVAMRFKAFVSEQTKEPKIELAALKYFPSPEGADTADIFCEGAGFDARNFPLATNLLGPLTEPEVVKKTRGESDLERDLECEAKQALGSAHENGAEGNAVLFIGHQP